MAPILASVPLVRVRWVRTQNNVTMATQTVTATPTVNYLTVPGPDGGHGFIDPLVAVISQLGTDDIDYVDVVATDDPDVVESFGWTFTFQGSTRPARTVSVPQSGAAITTITLPGGGGTMPTVWLDDLADFSGTSGPTGNGYAPFTYVDDSIQALQDAADPFPQYALDSEGPGGSSSLTPVGPFTSNSHVPASGEMAQYNPGSNLSITLGAAASGQRFGVANVATSGSYTVTLGRAGSDTIDGSTTLVLYPGERAVLIGASGGYSVESRETVNAQTADFAQTALATTGQVAASDAHAGSFGLSDALPLTLPSGVTVMAGAVTPSAREAPRVFELRGAVQSTSTFAAGALLATTQPAAQWPSGVYLTATGSTGPVRLVTAANGTLLLDSLNGFAAPTWVSLDGLRIPRSGDVADTTQPPMFLPVVTIDTGGVEIPAPSLDTYISANLTIDPNGNDVPAYSGTIQLSGHGNSTWSAPKKPYKVKLPAAAPLLGMASDKNWRLLANYYDKSNIRSVVAFEMARRTTMPWAPHAQFCEVVVNGVYVGLYQLTEPVKIGPARLNIDSMKSTDTTGLNVTGGFLLEISDQIKTGDVQAFVTTQGVRFIWDDPDTPTTEQSTYIQNYVQTFETALFSANWLDPSTGYAQYIDINSFADWYLVQELCSNEDSAFGSSCKIYKPRDVTGTPGKLHMGPVWDFDLSQGNGWNSTLATPVDWTHPPQEWWVRGATWFNRMLADPAFLAVLATRWAALSAFMNGSTGVFAWTDTPLANTTAAGFNDARRWGYAPDAYNKITKIRHWLMDRMAWLAPRLGTPVITNLVTNPSAEVNTDGWTFNAGTGGTGSMTRPTTGGYSGSSFMRGTWATGTSGYDGGIYGPPSTTVYPVSAGNAYTLSAWVRPSRSVRILVKLDWRDASNGALTASSQQVALTAGTWQRVSLTATAPANAVGVKVNFISTGGAGQALWVAGDTFDLDAVMLSPGATLWPYADGSYPHWTWAGTAHASSSSGWTP